MPGDRAVLFLASSGGGKSTMAGRLHALGYQAMGDDDVGLMVRDDGRVDVLATLGFQVLFERPLQLRCLPVGALCFVERSGRAFAIRIPRRYCFHRLVRSMWLPCTDSAGRRARSMENARHVAANVPGYLFSCPPGENPAALILSEVLADGR